MITGILVTIWVGILRRKHPVDEDRGRPANRALTLHDLPARPRSWQQTCANSQPARKIAIPWSERAVFFTRGPPNSDLRGVLLPRGPQDPGDHVERALSCRRS